MLRLVAAVAILVTVAVLLVVPFHPEATFLRLLDGMTPDTSSARRIDWVLVESGGNFVVFAIVGIAAFVITRRPIVAAALGCLLSAAAESVQLLIPNRVASWTDFITNCVGTLAGVVLARFVCRVVGRAKGSVGAER